MKKHPKQCVTRHGDGSRCKNVRMKPSIYCAQHQPVKKA